MLASLKMKDFLEFEDFFKDTKIEIYEKHVRDSAACEDYITSFQKLSDKIDYILTKAEKKPKLVAASC